MGGTLWEEPVFSLTYPGTKLQIFGGKGKNTMYEMTTTDPTIHSIVV